MSNIVNDEERPSARVIDLAGAGKIPTAIREFWKEKHGIDPVTAAGLIETALKQEREALNCFYLTIFSGLGILMLATYASWRVAAGTIITLGLVAIVLTVGGFAWRSKVLDKRASANRKLSKSFWDFTDAFDMFIELIRPLPLPMITSYSHEGLKNLVEKQLREIARLVLEEEAGDSPDEALPRVMQRNERAQSLHFDLVQAIEQMEVLGLSDGKYARYYELARRDLK